MTGSGGPSRQFRLDLAVTFGTEFLILGASLLVLRLATQRWGPAGFGEYVLARRTLGWVQLPVLCGLHLALARYVSMAVAEADRDRQASYLAGGALILLASLTLMAVVLLGAPGQLAFLMLGTSDAAPTIRWLILPIAGQVLHAAVYGALRGQRMMRSANGLQAFNLGVVPIAVLLLPGITVPRFLATLGLVWIGVCLCAVAGLLVVAPRVQADPAALRRAVRELLRYGIPRVPGEVALGALFTLPVIFAAHLSGTVEAGRISLGLSLVQLTGALFAPLGPVLLPTISAQVALAQMAAVRHTVTRMAVGGVLLAAGAVSVLELLCGWLFRVFFGAEYVAAVPLVRLILVAAVPYGVYVLLRSVLDAVHYQPMNSRNLVYAICAFLAVAVLVKSSLALPLAIVGAMVVLGGRTVRDVYHSVYGGRPGAPPAAVGSSIDAQTRVPDP